MGFTFIALQGFDLIAAVGGEVRDPSRTIPRAMLCSLAIALLIYLPLLFIIATVGVPPDRSVAQVATEQPAAIVAVAARNSGSSDHGCRRSVDRDRPCRRDLPLREPARGSQRTAAPNVQSHLEPLMRRVQCDVVVLRAPEGWLLRDVRRVLVPVAGRRMHNALRARLLGSIHRLGAREITLLRVIPGSATEDETVAANLALLRVAGG